MNDNTRRVLVALAAGAAFVFGSIAWAVAVVNVAAHRYGYTRTFSQSSTETYGAANPKQETK